MNNDLVNADLSRNAIIQHVSGDFLLTHKYHPAKNNYVERTRSTIKAIKQLIAVMILLRV